MTRKKCLGRDTHLAMKQPEKDRNAWVVTHSWPKRQCACAVVRVVMVCGMCSQVRSTCRGKEGGKKECGLVLAQGFGHTHQARANDPPYPHRSRAHKVMHTHACTWPQPPCLPCARLTHCPCIAQAARLAPCRCSCLHHASGHVCTAQAVKLAPRRQSHLHHASSQTCIKQATMPAASGHTLMLITRAHTPAPLALTLIRAGGDGNGRNGEGHAHGRGARHGQREHSPTLRCRWERATRTRALLIVLGVHALLTRAAC